MSTSTGSPTVSPNASPPSPTTPVDACTQTTLRRPPKGKEGKAALSVNTGTAPDDSAVSLTLSDTTQSPIHSLALSADVSNLIND